MMALWMTLQIASSTLPASSPPVPIATCGVTTVASSAAALGGKNLLFAFCGDKAAPLGPTGSYRAETNPTTGSVLVVRERDGNTEVLLASPTPNGVAVEDLTRELARLAGRFEDLGLGSSAVDITRFASSGSIGVTGKDGLRWLDLASYVQRTANRARIPSPSGGGGSTTSGAAASGARP